MYKVSVNGGEAISTELTTSGNQFSGSLGTALVNGDILRISDKEFHLLYNQQSYNIEVLKLNAEEKTMTLRVNSKKFTIQLQDKYDQLLKSLGMDALAAKKVNDIKAPMPGMVLKILVKEGDAVKKGDALLTLEAMKMENILKSPTDGVIKKVVAQQGTAVEKNSVLIQF